MTVTKHNGFNPPQTNVLSNVTQIKPSVKRSAKGNSFQRFRPPTLIQCENTAATQKDTHAYTQTNTIQWSSHQLLTYYHHPACVTGIYKENLCLHRVTLQQQSLHQMSTLLPSDSMISEQDYVSTLSLMQWLQLWCNFNSTLSDSHLNDMTLLWFNEWVSE